MCVRVRVRVCVQKYSKAVDVWAVGCIFGEMLRRKAMFPGADYMEQLKLIVECMGALLLCDRLRIRCCVGCVLMLMVC